MPKRKGYVRLRDIPLDLTDLLNRGETETATLTEQTAMDFAVLLGTLDGWSGNAAGLAQEAARQDFSGHGLVKRMELAGRMGVRAGCQFAPICRRDYTATRGVGETYVPLQAEPWHGLKLLEPCCRDESRYVQDSVANWLNDAARRRPEWVREVCRGWLRHYPDNSACCYIVKRALRNLSAEKEWLDE